MIALIAAALELDVIADVELTNSWGSLREFIDGDHDLDECPELGCFGLLRDFDISFLKALIAPRPVLVVEEPNQSEPSAVN